MSRLTLVCLILALLAAQAKADTATGWTTSRDALRTLMACRLAQEQMAMELARHRGAAGTYPASLSELGFSVVCPVTEAPYSYAVYNERYYLCCAGDNHADAGMVSNQPFTSGRGVMPMVPYFGAVEALGCASNLARLGSLVTAEAGRRHGRLPQALRLAATPVCPAAGADTYSRTYYTDGREFDLDCYGENHVPAGLGTSAPSLMGTPTESTLISAIPVPLADPRLGEDSGGAWIDLRVCESNLIDLVSALQAYATDHGGAVPANLRMLAPAYLATMPICPSAGRDSYVIGWRPNSSQFTVVCSGDNHDPTGAGPDFPRYDSLRGLQTHR